MMTTYTILYWQEIPSMIEATDGHSSSKVQLSDRFQDLIDTTAMERGLFGTDKYIESFKKGPCIESNVSAKETVLRIKDELENQYEEFVTAATLS